MDSWDYQLRWDNSELNKFKSEDFAGYKVNESTIGFLTNIGLPDSAAPFLNFDRKELNSVKSIYHLEREMFGHLLEIGSDGAGDPICIDLTNGCQIVALDHEDNFSVRFVNSSVRELFVFLTIYKEFAEMLIRLRGDDAFIDSNFKDEEIEKLIKDLKSVDERAMRGTGTFWNREIGIFIANRERK